MPVGRYIEIPGASFGGLPGAKRIVRSDVDEALAKIPSLQCYVDPAVFVGSPPVGRDRVSTSDVIATKTTISVVESAAFNDQKVFNFSVADGDLRFGFGTVTPSFTLIIPIMITSARIATGTQTFFLGSHGATYGEEVRASWTTAGSGGLFFQTDTDTSGSGVLTGLANVTGDIAAVWAWSYDHTLKKSRIYKNRRLIKENIHNDGPDIADDASWWLGNLATGSATTGLVGQIGGVATFSEALHLGKSEARLIRLLDLMCTKYNVT